MKIKFNKTDRINIRKYAKSYYNGYKESYIDNPDFELCIKNKEDLKCNTCEHKEKCGQGEKIWVENTDIIEELAEKILDLVEKKFNKKEVKNVNK